MAKQRLCPSDSRRWFREFTHLGFWQCIFQLVLLCMLCVLSENLVLRCMMFIFCVKEADLGMIALVAYLPLGFQNSTPCLSACTMHSVTRKQQPCPSNISGHLLLLGQGEGGLGCVIAAVH